MCSHAAADVSYQWYYVGPTQITACSESQYFHTLYENILFYSIFYLIINEYRNANNKKKNGVVYTAQDYN